MAKNNKDINKVVLAYSGGLDTSVILKWLQDTYDCEVVTFTADLGQGWVDLILYFIFFFPGVLALTFYGYDYAALAWKIKETSWSSPAQIQIYMVKALIPAAGVTLIIQGISEVLRSIICIQTGHWPARMVVAEETEKILMRTSQDEDQKDAI